MLTALDRRVVSAWSCRLFGKDKGSPRIAVVGGCQAFGVAYGMRLLLPQATVDSFPVEPHSLTDIGTLAKLLKSYDLVFCAEFAPGFVRGGDWLTLRALLPTITYPTVVFAGFHPDFIYVHKGEGSARNVLGPMGPYHSAIAIFAYLSGLTAAQALSLYDGAVFEQLGYFQVWNDACKHLLAQGKLAGMDLTQDLVRWSRHGCFMHTVNHPKAYVLFDAARALLQRAGIAAPDLDFDEFAFDPLASHFVCPLYEPIGERLGLRGSYVFRQGQPGRSRGGVLSLPQFVAESYRVYERLPRAMLANPRVDALLADEKLAGSLRAFAKEHVAG